jgi:hypothetical protein
VLHRDDTINALANIQRTLQLGLASRAGEILK